MAQTTADKLLIASQLRIGDIVNVRGESAIGKAIRFFTRSNINHSAVYIGNGLVMEAVIPLVCIMHIDEYIMSDKQEIYCCSVNGVDQATKESLISSSIQKYCVGTKYDVRGIFGLAFAFWIEKYWWRLARFFNFSGPNRAANPKDVWCSELVGRIYGEVGKKFTNEDVTYLTPDQIYNSSEVTKIN